MRAVLLSIVLFAIAQPTRAQEPPAQVDQVSPAGQGLPNTPTPKTEPDLSTLFNPNATEENSPCPAGIGKPCAMLGGRAYFPDLWHMTEHDKTWFDAMKHPPILIMSLLVLGTTAADIEGTDYCLHLHECREANPLMPKNANHAWQYSLALGVDALGIYTAGRMKQRGRGNRAFFELAVVSAIHTYFALQGFTVPPGPVETTLNLRHR